MGATLALTTTGAYSNGTTGGVSPLTYTGYDANVVSVDANGVVTALAGGTTTITITAPNGVKTTIMITVTGGTGGGLMNPNPQPGAKPNATAQADATVAPQPTRKADGTSGNTGAQPQVAGPTPAPTATPGAQPVRH